MQTTWVEKRLVGPDLVREIRQENLNWVATHTQAGADSGKTLTDVIRSLKAEDLTTLFCIVGTSSKEPVGYTIDDIARATARYILDENQS